jgi:solute carrier family 25 folate transporter 32
MPPSISPASSEERSDTHSRKIPSSDDRRHIIYRIAPFDAAKLSDHFSPTCAGATAGLVSAVITCPLDVIKTKLQAQGGWARGSRKADVSGKPRYSGLTGSARMIWRDEGLRGMYRGLGPLILGYLPTWMVYFTVYERAKGVLEKGENSPLAE